MSFGFNCTETPIACEHHDSMLGTALVSAGCALAIIIGGGMACWWKLYRASSNTTQDAEFQPLVTDNDNTSQQTTSSVKSCLCRCRREKNQTPAENTV